MAAAYIGGLVQLMHYISSFRRDTPDTLIDGVGALSLFVFSAAVMGFLFFYRPATLLVEGRRPEALSYFLKMLATFGAITLLVVGAVIVLQ